MLTDYIISADDQGENDVICLVHSMLLVYIMQCKTTNNSSSIIPAYCCIWNYENNS